MTSHSVPMMLFARLSKALGASSARHEFKWMKDHALDPSALQGMVQRRLNGEPLQYILGTQPFGPLELKVRRPVLIPRPETEDWTLRLARLLSSSSSSSNLRMRRTSREGDSEPLKLLDLCTGTGCIPLLLCHMWRQNGNVRALGVDIAGEAIELAKENAEHVKSQSQLNEENACISFLQADILDDKFPRMLLNESGWSAVDVLTCNPPYIPLHEYNLLSSSVRDFEDPRALLGDPSHLPELEIETGGRGRGLTFYHSIADLIRRHNLVRPGGLIALEVGHDQAAEVEHIMQSRANVSSAEVWNDPWGIHRTVVCTK
ncbi:S-adenosyl-L-methionine-dependent methyltransferase [Sanghuangporus baumii]|uniref:S-adenosyl-L-methionine-dependent methyltransferase n=1 Tax=Sanghuangporus baumii TaxID=108892 RepID=A0A9Q5ND43_SANBA|nr:S-adenosyl-L-methionine-dependent methyltransferase [Sanghuangporus baumii]